VYASPEASAQVGWASQYVTKIFVPHELPASLLNQLFHLSNREAADVRRLTLLDNFTDFKYTALDTFLSRQLG